MIHIAQLLTKGVLDELDERHYFNTSMDNLHMLLSMLLQINLRAWAQGKQVSVLKMEAGTSKCTRISKYALKHTQACKN